MHPPVQIILLVSQAVIVGVTQGHSVWFTFSDIKLRLPSLSLVIGGAASGKSAYAERIVGRAGLPKTYLATAEAFDAEMAAKIAAHQAARAEDGWHTIEAPRALAAAIAEADPEAALLIDCMTLWLSNTMLAEADWRAEWPEVLAAMQARPGPVVCVSNDVSGGIVPDNRLARAFQAQQGALNQALAVEAGFVALVTAGLPLALKGALP